MGLNKIMQLKTILISIQHVSFEKAVCLFSKAEGFPCRFSRNVVWQYLDHHMLYSDGIPSYPARLPFLRMFNFRLILRASAYQKVGLSIYHELSGSHYSVIKCCKGSCEKNEKYAYFMKRGTTQICFTTNVLHLITFHLYFRYSDREFTSIGF